MFARDHQLEDLRATEVQSNIIQDLLNAAPLFSDPASTSRPSELPTVCAQDADVSLSEQVAAQGLDCDLETFRDDLQKASELVIRLYGGLDEARITPAKNRVEIASLFDEPLPEAPQPMEAILREVENNIFANSTLYLSPRFFGYINSGGNQASVLGELTGIAREPFGP